MVRDGLYYLILARAKLIPPELHAGRLWRTLWPEQGTWFDGVSSEPEPLEDSSLGATSDTLDSLRIADNELDALVDDLKDQPDLAQHERLRAVLQARSSDRTLLTRVYDAHRRAIVERIQCEYEDESLRAKREQTIKDLRKESERYSWSALREIADDPQRQTAWLEKLEDGLTRYIFSLNAYEHEG